MAGETTFKVLLVDDDPGLRRIYSRALAAEGFQVLEAAGGDEAVADFSRDDFDIILLDIRMSSADSKALALALRRFHPRAKIIVSSCYPKDSQKEMVPSADDYFDKTEGSKALLLKIKNFLYV